jgi:hypothetical protein
LKNGGKKIMGSPKKWNPKTTDNLASEVDLGFDELGKLPSRLDRYATAHERTIVNLSQIRERVNKGDIEDPFISYLVKVGARVARCGHYLGFRHYYTVDKLRLTAAEFCKVHLLCPLCAIRRGSKMVETLVERYNIIIAENPGLKMSMITLTVQNGDDLTERHEHLKAAFQRLLKRRRKAKEGKSNTEFAKIEGLFGSYEVTNKGNGWHPHIHLIVLHRDRINAAALKREWKAITGDSHVLRIDPCRHPEDPAQDFLEVCKYALKFGDLSPEQNLDAYEALRGKRLVVSAGLFWGLEIPEDLTDDPLEDLPYFDMLYKFVAGSGYNLTTRENLHD